MFSDMSKWHVGSIWPKDYRFKLQLFKTFLHLMMNIYLNIWNVSAHPNSFKRRKKKHTNSLYRFISQTDLLSFHLPFALISSLASHPFPISTLCTSLVHTSKNYNRASEVTAKCFFNVGKCALILKSELGNPSSGNEVGVRERGEAPSTRSALPRSRLREASPDTWETELRLDPEVLSWMTYWKVLLCVYVNLGSVSVPVCVLRIFNHESSTGCYETPRRAC